MPAWHAADDLNAPARRPDKNDPTAESAANRRPTKPVRRLLHFGAVAVAPWLDPGGLPDCHRQCPAPAERRGRHHPFASAANRFRRCANASWTGVDRIARPSAGWRAPLPYFLLQNELRPSASLPTVEGWFVFPGALLLRALRHLPRPLAPPARPRHSLFPADSNLPLSAPPEFASRLPAG